MRGGLRALKYLNTEQKFIDNQQTENAVTSTFNVVDLVNTTQGDTGTSRDGRQIKLTSILHKFTIAANATAATNLTRIILLIDKQPNGATVTPADYLTDVTINDSIVSPRNLDNIKRFTLLYDKVFTTTASASTRRISRKFYKKLNMIVRYDGNAGDVTDLTTRNVVLLTVGDQAVNGALLTSFIRIRFVDN